MKLPVCSKHPHSLVDGAIRAHRPYGQGLAVLSARDRGVTLSPEFIPGTLERDGSRAQIDESETNDVKMQKPYDNSFWVTPGQLLAGEYPGSKDEAEARQKVGALLDTGITYFVDLTEEGELRPYAHLLPEEAASRGKMVIHSRCPIQDTSVTSRGHMVEILNEIDTAISNGHGVYVHCWGGVGRTGTVVGCWLARHGHAGEAALIEVGRLWRDMSADKVARHPCSPHTSKQRWMVRNWSETHSEPL